MAKYFDVHPDNPQRRAITQVVGILRDNLNGLLGRYVTDHRRHVVAAFEGWWDKYRVTLTSIERERNAAMQKLRGLLGGLGYGA